MTLALALAFAISASAPAPAPSRTTAAPTSARPAPAAAAAAPISRVNYVNGLNASFSQLDANRDGKLVEAELKAAVDRQTVQRAAQFEQQRQQLFAKLDKDRNGQLSQAEFMAAVVPPKTATLDIPSLLKRTDRNGDGKLTLDEYRTPSISNFDKLDINRDGFLSPEERKAGKL